MKISLTDKQKKAVVAAIVLMAWAGASVKLIAKDCADRSFFGVLRTQRSELLLVSGCISTFLQSIYIDLRRVSVTGLGHSDWAH
jgi:hypothetical protein